jgi:hypothetical protein
MYSYQDWLDEKIILNDVTVSYNKGTELNRVSLKEFDIDSRNKVRRMQKYCFNRMTFERAFLFCMPLIHKLANITSKRERMTILKSELNLANKIIIGKINDKALITHYNGSKFENKFLIELRDYHLSYTKGTKLENYEWINPPHSKYAFKPQEDFRIYYYGLRYYVGFLRTIISRLEAEQKPLVSNKQVQIPKNESNLIIANSLEIEANKYTHLRKIFRNASDVITLVTFLQKTPSKISISEISFLYYYFQEKNSYSSSKFLIKDFLFALYDSFKVKAEETHYSIFNNINTLLKFRVRNRPTKAQKYLMQEITISLSQN